jgi:hypothetical protein
MRGEAAKTPFFGPWLSTRVGLTLKLMLTCVTQDGDRSALLLPPLCWFARPARLLLLGVIVRDAFTQAIGADTPHVHPCTYATLPRATDQAYAEVFVQFVLSRIQPAEALYDRSAAHELYSCISRIV